MFNVSPAMLEDLRRATARLAELGVSPAEYEPRGEPFVLQLVPMMLEDLRRAAAYLEELAAAVGGNPHEQHTARMHASRLGSVQQAIELMLLRVGQPPAAPAPERRP